MPLWAGLVRKGLHSRRGWLHAIKGDFTYCLNAVCPFVWAPSISTFGASLKIAPRRFHGLLQRLVLLAIDTVVRLYGVSILILCRHLDHLDAVNDRDYS